MSLIQKSRNPSDAWCLLLGAPGAGSKLVSANRCLYSEVGAGKTFGLSLAANAKSRSKRGRRFGGHVVFRGACFVHSRSNVMSPAG